MTGPKLTGVVAVLALLGWCFIRPALAEIVCADDLLPDGMAVTATGTAPTCAGSCRARETKPVCGPIMKICAGQPIPKGYVLDSITTTPGCECLGEQDNAYVIRYAGTQDDSSFSSDADPYSSDEYQDQDNLNQNDDDSSGGFGSQASSGFKYKERYPYGDPPFGNVLCVSRPMRSEPYNNPSSSNPSQLRGFQPPQNGLQFPGNSSEQPGYEASSPWSMPEPLTGQDNEPFRVGQ